ncbi:LutC/YkgG family protein [Paludibacterium paludis]|uniref:Lactate utilization protein C n=1 Tax=Paludibacterium paludis TaxID=1225769 RepID=A0A918UAN3_9NEIS|nr:lactate utilization protein [Paludibacterium paludis]GGY17796.1 lactate utilization protein C [Paludibacterium paludis]
MSARDAILGRLRAAAASELPRPDLAGHFRRFAPQDGETERIARWAKAMRTVKTTVLWTDRRGWSETLADWATERGIASLRLPDTEAGREARRRLETRCPNLRLSGFTRDIEDCKHELFHDTEAGFTGARCGIAATGTLVLWPDGHEPRTLSLVPPVHVVLFDTTTLYPDFYTAMTTENWSDGMPTNALLISGPSKTADIQMTLAYGAHGPRELVVLAMLPGHLDPATLEEAAR